MSEELLINVTPMECRVALIQNGTVNELFVERTVKRGLVGNIYKGKVVRVFRVCRRLLSILDYPELHFYISMIWFGHVISQCQMFLSFYIRGKFLLFK
jgi:hypothetical protein